MMIGYICWYYADYKTYKWNICSIWIHITVYYILSAWNSRLLIHIWKYIYLEVWLDFRCTAT